MKRFSRIAGCVVLVLLGACRQAQTVQPPARPSLSVLETIDFRAGVASVSLPGLRADESVAVIPVYAAQAQTPAVGYAVTASGLQTAAAPAVQAEAAARPGKPRDLRKVRHLAQVERNIARATRLRRAGARPLNGGLGAANLSDNCPAPYVVGSTICDFYVTRAGGAEETRVATTLRFESANAYWFVDDRAGSEFSNADLARLGQAFEDEIVPVDTGYFGAFPDFDGNGKLFIVFTSLDAYGYVSSLDFFDDDDTVAQTGYRSNEGDILYVYLPSDNIRFGFDRESYFTRNLPSTMVHELKHLIALGGRTQLPEGTFQGYEASWFEEASAVAAEELSPYGSSLTRYAQGQAKESLEAPAKFRVVDDDERTGPEGGSYYGYNFLQLWRIAERVGHKNFWKSWTAGPETGVANIEKNAPALGSFADMMTDWATVLMFDHTGLVAGYDYKTLNLRDGSWAALEYAPLTGAVSGETRSLAYYVGRGSGRDATVSVRRADPALSVVVVRFTGELPY